MYALKKESLVAVGAAGAAAVGAILDQPILLGLATAVAGIAAWMIISNPQRKVLARRRQERVMRESHKAGAV